MGKKIKQIFKIIEDSLKLQILVCVAFCSIVIIAFLVLNRVIEQNKFYEYTIKENIKLINSIENFSIDNSKIILDGYAFASDRDSKNSSISLFFLSTDSGNEVWSKINQIDREDVDLYFSAENNYRHSGFKATVGKNELKDDECYEVIINVDYPDGRQTVSSNRFILNGKLYSYNPDQFDIPDLDVQSELLRKVFSEGKLCHYQKDAGMYIYQYSGKLYWIANTNFAFDENGQTAFPYLLHTSQVNKLPAHRVQNEFDNLHFIFEQYEYKDEVTEPYRVAIRDIPDDYAITYITTGNYNTENSSWFWKTSFHLDDLFIN